MRTQRWIVLWFLIVAAGLAPAATPASQRDDGERSPGGSAGADVPRDWWTEVRRNLAASEYEITRQAATPFVDAAAAWQAPNRAHGFRTYFTPAGIRVVPREEEAAAPSWQWSLSWVGYGRGGESWAVPGAVLEARGSRMEYGRGGLEEYYENGPRGLEQGFVLSAPPEEVAEASGAQPLPAALPLPGGGRRPGGESLVHLDLALAGDLRPVISEDGQVIDFLTGSGARVVRYAELRVTDAAGREVPSWMEGLAGEGVRGIRLVLDAADVVWPLAVDPLATSPAWTGESEQGAARFGHSVATAGDVNGDGYSDIIVGATYYDNGQTDEGRAYVYLGSASGLAASPAWTVESDQSDARFGWAVATAGDVNGDGYSDVIVGAHWYDNNQPDEGRAYVYLGSASGLGSSPAWTAESDQAAAFFGDSVAAAGDVNGDGYSDVLVGASFYDNGQSQEGRAYVYLGSASGLGSSPSWTAESDQGNSYFGHRVATAGDVNSDGYSDVIVGAYSYDNGQTDEGRAFVYLGSASGLASSPAWTAESDQAGSYFGSAVAMAGDVNGDGYSDVIVGAYGYGNGQTGEGRAFVYLGSASGLASSPAWTAESDQALACFGVSVATAGDVNGDGYSDIIVGAYEYDNGETDEGRAYVYLGSASGLVTFPAWTAESDQASAQYGYSVATAGDVNGDGYSDVIVGAESYDNGETDEGRAFVYPGSAAGPATSAAWAVESQQGYVNYGYSVASAGDVNGDGYSDVIVGAYRYPGRAYVYLGSASGLATTAAWTAVDQSGSEFGYSVASAGDVNGDGYSDVIVGEPWYISDGKALVYHGSASGLSTTPAWTARGGQADCNFGNSVASAGDVNGDGYSDVIVGAEYYTTSFPPNYYPSGGVARVFLGSASGLGATAAWNGRGEQKYAYFGHSVASAGDVDGDGYSEVIVGAYNFTYGQTSEGRVYVFRGSEQGVGRTGGWVVESNQAGAYFGYSVSSAGDVNGDGYSDVIIGATGYDDDQTDEGRAYLYLGSASGLVTPPAWTAESHQTGSDYGFCVASAGDVNGDGYSDVVVGARYIHEAYVYLGSASGLSPSPAWTGGPGAYGNFGASVASAGDVSGDGYSDVIVGEPFFSNMATYEGKAYVFYGNGFYGNNWPGLSLRPQQRRADDSAPVERLLTPEALDGFRLAVLGRTPFGRGKVKLEWEVKPLGALLDGTGTQVSPSWMDTGTAGVAFDELVTSLAQQTVYHWRVRLHYHPAAAPPQQRSRWLTVPWGGWQEGMLRTGPHLMAAGRVPDQPYWPGTPLTVTEATGGDITLDWDVSCLVTDTDYAIYEGTIGAFYSHAALFCSTEGATTKTFTPSAGNTYYLVAPLSGSREGSYGMDSGGGERPPATTACLPQLIGTCP